MVEFTNGLPDLGSPVRVSPLQVLHLAEELRLALELHDGEGRDTLRSQLPCSTVQTLLEWLDKAMVSLSIMQEEIQMKIQQPVYERWFFVMLCSNG